MVLVELLVSEFQIRGPRDGVTKRVIRAFLFEIIKLSLLCLVSYLGSMYWNLVWNLFGMASLCTPNMKFRTWYKLCLYTLKIPFSSMNFLELVIPWLSFLAAAFTACLFWLAIFLSFDLVALPRLYCYNLNNYVKTRNTRLSLYFYQDLIKTILPCLVDQYFLKTLFLGCGCGRSR